MPNRADQALKLMGQAHRLGRLGHAYLITGPKEAKREAFAARLLNLITSRDEQDLGAWAALGFPVVSPESKSRRIKIEDIRALEHEIHLKPGPLGWKFGIITDCERMTPQAQNAFLKTLEEPPPGTLLLLLTGKPQELLPTILSRVIEINLIPEPGSRQLSEHENALLALLGQLANRPNTGTAGALALKAGFEAILNEVYDEIEEELEDDFDREKELYKQTTDSTAYLKNREDQMKAQIESTYLLQREALLELMLAWVGDIIRLKVGSENLDVPEARASTSAMVEKWTMDDAAKRLGALRKLESHLHTNVNEALALEVGFMDAFG
jgi:DNA polymerase III subunit delta'